MSIQYPVPGFLPSTSFRELFIKTFLIGPFGIFFYFLLSIQLKVENKGTDDGTGTEDLWCRK